MAVTKAQLLVWGLIVGLVAGGCTMLSRVTLHEELLETASVAAPVSVTPVWVVPPPVSVAVPATVVAPVMEVAEATPAAIAEFPFPEFPAEAAVDEPAVAIPQAAFTVVEIPADALPDIAAMTEEAAPEVVAEAPPIPAPGRPAASEPTGAATLYVAAETLNVRAAPSTDGTVLQKLRLGFAIAPKQRSDDWIGFAMKDGSTGWLRADFLSAMKPVVVATETQQEPGPLNLM